MNRRELVRLMPRDAKDREGALRVVALGWPTVEPVLPDMIRCLRVYQSPVADVFAEFLATVGAPAADVVAWRGLQPENASVRHRLLADVLPHWSRDALQYVTFMLTTTATQPDALDNDVRAVELLARHRLVDLGWLAGWLDFKRERLEVRQALLARARTAVDDAARP